MGRKERVAGKVKHRHDFSPIICPVLLYDTQVSCEVYFNLAGKEFPNFFWHMRTPPLVSLPNQMEPYTSPYFSSLRHILIIPFNVRPGISDGLFFYFFLRNKYLPMSYFISNDPSQLKLLQIFHYFQVVCL